MKLYNRIMKINNEHEVETMTNRNQSLSGIVWLTLVLCLVGAGQERVSAAETTTLVITGDAAPDGNGIFSGFEPVQPLNANGKVAFIASLTGTQSPSTDGRGIFIADTKSITQLVRTGETTPDGNGSFQHFSSNFGVIERLVLNDNDTVAFFASLTGTTGGSTDNIGLFGASAVGGVKQFVRASDSAPDGNGVFASGELGLSPPGLDNNNAAMFYGRFVNTSGGEQIDDSGVFRSDGNTISRVIRTGATIPGGGDAFEDVPPYIASNLGGQVVLSAILAFEFTGEPPGDDLQRIYVHTDTILNEIFRGGTPVPDGNGIVTNAWDLSTNINGNVIFIGNVSDSGNFNLDVPRLFITDGVTLKQIARQSELAPGEQTPQGELPFRFGSFFEIRRDSNAAGKVAFSMTLERNTAEDNRSSGIYLGDGNTTKLVLHEGDAVPGGDGAFGNVAVPLFLNNSGEIAFASSLEGTSDPAVDNRGIFFIGSDGVVQTVARNGMTLAGSTIMDAFFLGDHVNQFALSNSDLSTAGMDAINDSGQVVFWAILADGRSGIFLWNSTAVPPDDDTIYADSFE